MNEADRHRRVLDFLKGRPFATVRELGEVVDASPATIRRDIGKLHIEGSVRKVFGGIASTESPNVDRLAARPFQENQMLGVAAKLAIAAEAEKLVSDGDSLIINGGSTCYLFAERWLIATSASTPIRCRSPRSSANTGRVISRSPAATSIASRA